MSDPEVEAAQRAWRTASHGRRGDLPSSEMVTAMITDAAREALKPVRELHRPMVIQCLAPNCGAEVCDHEDECPVDYPVAVCAKCWEIAELANAYYGEEGVGDAVLWPCDTAKRIYPTEELA